MSTVEVYSPKLLSDLYIQFEFKKPVPDNINNLIKSIQNMHTIVQFKCDIGSVKTFCTFRINIVSFIGNLENDTMSAR